MERDERPIDTLLLAQVDTGEKRPAEPGSAYIVPVIKTDEELAAWTRAALTRCGAKVAQDVIELGCTGIAGGGANVDQIKKLRIGLAGSGLGLTCYVGPDRYCLAHETIGGLQEGQAQRHAEYVMAISRELAPNERSHVAVIEAARRVRSKTTAAEALTGRKTDEDFLQEVGHGLTPPETEIDLDTPAPASAPAPQAAPAPPPAVIPAGTLMAVVPATVHAPGERAFVCPDHDTTQWHCRYCVAEEIVHGPLSPVFLMGHAAVDSSVQIDDMEETDSDKIEERLQKFDDGGFTGAVLFVKVARWVRKLARA